MEKPGQGALPAVWNVTDAVKARIVQHKRVAVQYSPQAEFQQLAWRNRVSTRSPTRPLPAKALRALFVFIDGDNVRTSALVR